MADGPNYEQLFNGCKCLNADSNLKEIVSRLRFNQGDEASYQKYLKHYVPMFAKPEHEEFFNEFVKDLKDEEKVKELKASLKALIAFDEEMERVKAAPEAPKEEEKKEEKKAEPKKYGKTK